ncbi:hypothetical protein [Sphingomonas kyeonggiensis]|uniref:YD repeat-containing protein n=1 Tax=Sphingomonas kyeonggiensis TaxID=1268553 RepID=A0A7W6JVA5_9SPHN|nr:hypothetical protein [Sphingomonas kyeonggiensis]MBB4100215.1 hypothetical protein [Sphingomonas kyeonggiensis]
MSSRLGTLHRRALKAALLAGLAAGAVPAQAQETGPPAEKPAAQSQDVEADPGAKPAGGAQPSGARAMSVAAASAGAPSGDPQFSNPLMDLYPAQERVDSNDIDLSNGKLHLRDELIPGGSDKLGVGLNFVSPGFAIVPVHYSSDPPLSISNNLGQIVYASLTTNAILAWQQANENGVSFVNFDAPANHDRFANIGSGFYNAANTSSSVVPWGAGYLYTSKDGATAEISNSLTYLQLHVPLAPGSGYYGNVVTKLTQPNGEVWTYYYDSGTFQLVPSGTIFTTSRIRSIVSNRGYALQFSYQRDAGSQSGTAALDQWYSVTQIVKYDKARGYCNEAAGRCASFGGSPQVVSVGYDRSANTVRFVRPNGEALKFGFAPEPRWGAWRLVSFEKGDLPATRRTMVYREYPDIVYPGGSSIPNPITWLDNVQSVTAGGRTWSYEYSGSRYAGSWDSSAAMRRTDPSGKAMVLDMALSQDPPTRMTDQLARATEFGFFRYSWTSIVKGAFPGADQVMRPNEAQAYPSTVSLPEDTSVSGTHVASYQFTYDDRGNRVAAQRNAKAGSGLSPIVWAASFPACGDLKVCNKPSAITDPRGAVTNYGYDATHGGMVWEMQPAPTTGGARPFKLYSYVQKYAYVLSAGGSLVPSPSPLWVLATATECQTAAGSDTPACDAGAPRRVVTYEYGPDGTTDNLLVRGVAVAADGQVQRTCLGYDAQGNQVSVTTPRAGLGTCQ